MGKGQLAGLPNWLKKLNQTLEARVKKNETDISNLNSEKVITGNITKYSELTIEEAMLALHNDLLDNQSVSANLLVGTNSRIIMGTRVNYNRGRYLIMSRTSDTVQSFKIGNDGEYTVETLATRSDLAEKGSSISLFDFNKDNNGVLLTNSQTFVISDEVKEFISNNNYLLKVVLNCQETYNSASNSAMICAFNAHYPVLMDRINLQPTMIRLQIPSGTTVTFQAFGDTPCYLASVTLIKL